MRALRLFALAAALVVPAAAAHAQYGVYVPPTPVYGAGWVPGHWAPSYYGEVWIPGHPVVEYERGYGYSRWDRDDHFDRDRHHDRDYGAYRHDDEHRDRDWDRR